LIAQRERFALRIVFETCAYHCILYSKMTPRTFIVLLDLILELNKLNHTEMARGSSRDQRTTRSAATPSYYEIAIGKVG
jgi:hypothetical protein